MAELNSGVENSTGDKSASKITDGLESIIFSTVAFICHWTDYSIFKLISTSQLEIGMNESSHGCSETMPVL